MAGKIIRIAIYENNGKKVLKIDQTIVSGEPLEKGSYLIENFQIDADQLAESAGLLLM